ncbi:MAG: sialidase family protein [Bacteroidetes bacterium]|nr:sialidase family protein [Bacteroidota bacterium]
MVKKILPFLFFTMICFQAMAQSRFPIVLVNSGSGQMYNEPSICINPKNTNQMVAGSVINNYYYSSDEGVTWNGGVLSSSYGVWGDPAITVDTNGNYYYIHLSYGSGSGWWIDRIVCQKSTNGGSSWNDGSYMGFNPPLHQQDKAWPVVDRRNNNIYVTWTQFDQYGTSNPADSSIILFSKSTDGATSWSAPKRISRRAGDCVDGSNTVEGAVPAVGPAGQIYVTWAGPLGLMFNRSLDQGTTWVDSNIFVSNMPGGWNISISGIDRSNGMPVTCCDLSNGPYRGNVYVNWADIRNGSTDCDIFFTRSTDGGSHWSAPKRVNDDSPGKQQFFTWMTVDNKTGYIYVIFYDRRLHSGDSTDVYLAVSRDAGLNFENIRLSANAFLPTSGEFFGDYTNISAYNNIVRPIWEELSDGHTKKIFTALIDSVYASTITWVGGKSTDWNNPWNWSPWSVPTATQNVIIPQVGSGKVYPAVNVNGLTCKNLTINTNASVTLPASRTFDIKGNLTIRNGGSMINNGSVTIRGILVNENIP